MGHLMDFKPGDILYHRRFGVQRVIVSVETNDEGNAVYVWRYPDWPFGAETPEGSANDFAMEATIGFEKIGECEPLEETWDADPGPRDTEAGGST